MIIILSLLLPKPLAGIWYKSAREMAKDCALEQRSAVSCLIRS